MNREQLEMQLAEQSDMERIQKEVVAPLNEQAGHIEQRLKATERVLESLFEEYAGEPRQSRNADATVTTINRIKLFAVNDPYLGEGAVYVKPHRYHTKFQAVWYDLVYSSVHPGQQPESVPLGFTTSRDGVNRNMQAGTNTELSVGVNKLHSYILEPPRKIEFFRNGYLPKRMAEVEAFESGVEMIVTAIQDEELNPHARQSRERAEAAAAAHRAAELTQDVSGTFVPTSALPPETVSTRVIPVSGLTALIHRRSTKRR